MKHTSYAFLGMLIPENNYYEVINQSKCVMQDAANVLQWHLYKGLCQNLKYPIHIINVLPVYSWPQYYKKIWIRFEKFSTEYSNDNYNVGYCNLSGVRKYFKSQSVYRALSEWCHKHENQKVLFVYTLSQSLLRAVCKVKEQYSDLQVCAIVADLPEMSNLSSKVGLLHKMGSNMSVTRSYKFSTCIDYYVLLTEHMAEYMQIDKPYCVVEGIAASRKEYEKNIINRSNNKKIILYSGTLHRRFGVWNLVEAFSKISGDEYRLILCGVGDCEDDIKKASLRDTRICFLGRLSREEVLKLQRNATVVVNPRQNIEEFTKYSFPSKNLEYLSSGVPLIAYKLDGIPDEYDDYIFYVKDNSIEALTDKLIEVCNYSDSELMYYGLKAQKFVFDEKNEILQTKKIVMLLNKGDFR